MILNKAFGPVEQLPFDLKMKRVMVYDTSRGDIDRATERKELQKSLEKAVLEILKDIPQELPTEQLSSLDLEARLKEYRIEDVSSRHFAVNSLTKQLVVINLNRKFIHPSASTTFIAIPSTPQAIAPHIVFEKARELFDKNKWYASNTVGPAGPSFRFFSAKAFPLGRTFIRMTQNAVIIEDKNYEMEGNFFSLQINDKSEIAFATSLYAVSTPHDMNNLVFHLGGTIHLLWSFLCLVREFHAQLNYSGNYHFFVAMKNTENSLLGDFADGWPDVLKRNYMRGPEFFGEVCHTPNILISRENIDLSNLEYKIEHDVIREIAEEIARAYNQEEARCFDKRTNKLPENLWPVD